jgi:hypothetical protein
LSFVGELGSGVSMANEKWKMKNGKYGKIEETRK